LALRSSAGLGGWHQALACALPRCFLLVGAELSYATLFDDYRTLSPTASALSARAQVRLELHHRRGARLVVEVECPHTLCSDPEAFGRQLHEQLAAHLALPADREAEALEDAPKLKEHVVGFRLWRFKRRSRHALEALFADGKRWDRGNWIRAQGCLDHGGAPGPDCHCGFNAFHEPAAAHRQYAAQARDKDVVLGAIQAKGRLEVHADGFRCEWARPIAVVRAKIPPLGNASGVQTVESPEELVQVALDYGSPIPSELRPPPVDRSMYGGPWGPGVEGHLSLRFA
jgi:hypothetical protein